MDMVEPQKSDLSLNSASARFAAADIPLQDLEQYINETCKAWWEESGKWWADKSLFEKNVKGALHQLARHLVIQNDARGTVVSTDVLATLRKVVEGYIVRIGALEEQLSAERNRAFRGEESDIAKFKTLSEFEHNQAQLVRVVEASQEDARKSRQEADSYKRQVDALILQRDNEQRLTNEWYEKSRIQEAANVTLLRQIAELESGIETLQQEVVNAEKRYEDLLKVRRDEQAAKKPTTDYYEINELIRRGRGVL